MEANRNVILESNSVLQFVRPDLYIVVIDLSVADMKKSARLFLNRADAFVIVETGTTELPWKDVPARWFTGKPKFRAQPPEYVERELIAFVRTRMSALHPS
jgi:hypothetical protein